MVAIRKGVRRQTGAFCMARGPREVNLFPQAIEQGGERDFSGQVESEVKYK